MCLVLTLCGVFAILKKKKKKKSLASFPLQIQYCRTIYIRTLVYFKIEKNKKERQGNKKNYNNLILRKIIFVGIELTIPDFGGQRANHWATTDLKVSVYLSYL